MSIAQENKFKFERAICQSGGASVRLNAKPQRAIDLLQERRTALISAAVTGQIDLRQHLTKEQTYKAPLWITSTHQARRCS